MNIFYLVCYVNSNFHITNIVNMFNSAYDALNFIENKHKENLKEDFDYFSKLEFSNLVLVCNDDIGKNPNHLQSYTKIGVNDFVGIFESKKAD